MIITAPADGPAPKGARPSAGAVMISTKPLLEPVLTYCQLDIVIRYLSTEEQTSVKCQSKYYDKNLRKCFGNVMQSVDHFV